MTMIEMNEKVSVVIGRRVYEGHFDTFCQADKSAATVMFRIDRVTEVTRLQQIGHLIRMHRQRDDTNLGDAESLISSIDMIVMESETIRDNQEACPDCGRLKARSAVDITKGHCPKWFAHRDDEAHWDCAKFIENKRKMESKL